MFTTHMVLDHLEQLVGVFQFNNLCPMWGGDPPPPFINYDSSLYYIFCCTGRVFGGSADLCFGASTYHSQFETTTVAFGSIAFWSLCDVTIPQTICSVDKMVLLDPHNVVKFIIINNYRIYQVSLTYL